MGTVNIGEEFSLYTFWHGHIAGAREGLKGKDISGSRDASDTTEAVEAFT